MCVFLCVCVCLPPAGPSGMIKRTRLRSANANTHTLRDKLAEMGLLRPHLQLRCAVEQLSISSLSQTLLRGLWRSEAGHSAG